jgi:farnesyl-diphosphate farnesyltransferase
LKGTLLERFVHAFLFVVNTVESLLQVCLLYLVLRGLDAIEDDMSIPDHIKQPILRSFHVHTVTPGWNFTGYGPSEKDRQLLVEYDTVIEEVNTLPDTCVYPPSSTSDIIRALNLRIPIQL